MLTLPIKRKWLDMIRKGTKKEEYRDLTSYYHQRFRGSVGETITLRLRNGYSSESPTVEIKAAVLIGRGKKEWGADPDKEYYVLRILEHYDVLPETFTVKARRCKRCGGLLTSAQAVKDGYGHICKIKSREETGDKNQIGIYELITAQAEK